MSKTTKIALLVFYAGFLGIVAGGCLASVSVADIPAGLKWGLRFTAVLLLIGAVLCWWAGWKRFKEECAPFAGKSLIRFVIYVVFAPYTLPFSDIEFPKWLP